MQDEKSWILNFGGVAQLGEHLPCKQGVMSSNLTISTRWTEVKLLSGHQKEVTVPWKPNTTKEQEIVQI